ncbi:MAG: hypothetical protein KJ798_00465 [Gammaproteobacteria bacterium]|uniref:hypothetical protein n=1 Tax=Limnobacter sp. TaxID=2003368 RepID=UPI001DC01C21|nr:hypothetical protein [Limnobacter sp.]MBU0784060.1 hypothetical protein [Gammaproteobacteria bacterium]MBU0848956.1 hypothetical protein [Gammaproteobacteria bacterium]MBU1268232.1 hypothetical protein [Gammaproteobacteria bacterium]MBU1527789.1 hypothetical protein [Gammaproteobacteria bacterium]MBU1778831.1 hypothetical protein [Gammaproteobacteria bacterium]
MLSFLLSVGLAFGSIDLSLLPARQVEQIAKEVMLDMQTDLQTKPSLIVTKRGEPTPLGALAYANGKCVVIINTNEAAWSQWGRFLNEGNRALWPQIIAASVAHEMGHCLRESRKFAASYKLDEDEFLGLESTGGFGPQPEMVYKQELFADTVAILYAREHAGSDSNDVIRAMIQAREHYGANEPTHNTSKALKQLLNTDMQRLDNETLGVAATRLLAAL